VQTDLQAKHETVQDALRLAAQSCQRADKLFDEAESSGIHENDASAIRQSVQTAFTPRLTRVRDHICKLERKITKMGQTKFQAEMRLSSGRDSLNVVAKEEAAAALKLDKQVKSIQDDLDAAQRSAKENLKLILQWG